MYKKVLFVLALALLLSSCGVLGGVNLTGNWTGALAAGGASAPITMALTQNGSDVTGTVSGQGESIPATGTLTGSNLTLTVDGIVFTGTATGTSINTTSTVSTENGSVQLALTATKQ